MSRNCAWGLELFLVLVAIPANAAGDPPAQPGHVLDLRVIERDGETPIAGVAVRSLPGHKDEPGFRGMTDEHGRCSVPVPADVEKTHDFAIQLWRDGFIPIRVLWGHTRAFEFEGVPTAYTVILGRGTPIGGFVRDEQGRPVGGARIFPALSGRRSELEYLDLPGNTSFTTDAQGRWGCAILPASCETGELSLRVEHPRFVSSGKGYDRRLSIKDLRALTATMVMQTGFNLRGTVSDQAGKPIEGATVVWRSADEQDGGLRAKTGADGRFQFENRPPGISLITAEVPGLATSVKQVQVGPPDPNQKPPLVREASSDVAVAIPSSGSLLVARALPVLGGASPPIDATPPATDLPISPAPPAVTPAMIPSDATQLTKDGPCEPPLLFRLGPGRTIRGRVVDTKGRPVAGARITHEFRGRSDLLSWQGETDAEGRFEWTNAPHEVDVLTVENVAEDQMIRCFGPGAREREIAVTMPAPFRLRGKVVDAETGQPIETFRLIEGNVWTHDFMPEEDERPPDWSTGRARTITGGRYEVRFARPGRPTEPRGFWYTLKVVRIEAEGYASAISRKYSDHEGEQTCDFALRKHPWIIGTIRATDGSPAAGAEVVVAVKGQPVPGIYNGRLAQDWPGDVIRTDPDGRFAFAKPDAGGRVVIVSDRGLAQRTVDELAAKPDVTLQPWGRIGGKLRVGSGVGSSQLVGAQVTEPDYRGQPVVPITALALTDAEGRFLLDRIAPGHAIVYRPYWSSSGTMLRSHRQGVDSSSGQTVEVLMGGAGRPVVGRVIRAAGLPSFELIDAVGWLRLIQPAPQFPNGFDDWDADRQQAWWYAFYQTAEGRTYYERMNAYLVMVRLDGSFRIDDVPEGHYRLAFEYTKSPDGVEQDPLEGPTRVAELSLDLDVSAGPDDQPMDLGTLTLAPIRASDGRSMTRRRSSSR